jgi:hypothetical protein
MNAEQITLKVFNIATLTDFNELALEVFHYQYKNNQTYKTFIDGVCRDKMLIVDYSQIPCLPIEFFKTNHISSMDVKPELVFHSSGTTSQFRSTHNIYSEEIYRQSILKSFMQFYGDPAKYIICALVPDYRTHGDSSLAYMLNYLTGLSSFPQSGFYMGKEEKLLKVVIENPETPKIIFGITYALLNFAQIYSAKLQNTIIIETGGMKGKMKEIIRAEVHELLTSGFHCPIHSEYSMAELMSQAYLTNSGRFSTPPWMKISIRMINDPLSNAAIGQIGGINIIDLANFHTCSFIATQDLGILHENGAFEVMGRFDNSDIRGCNLLSIEL